MKESTEQIASAQKDEWTHQEPIINNAAQCV